MDYQVNDYRKLSNGEYQFSFPLAGCGNFEDEVATIEVDLSIGTNHGINTTTQSEISCVLYTKNNSIPLAKHFQGVATDLVSWLKKYSTIEIIPNQIYWFLATNYYGDQKWQSAHMVWNRHELCYNDQDTFFTEVEVPHKSLFNES